MSIIMQGAIEWFLEQQRRSLVESLEREGIEVPVCLKETMLPTLESIVGSRQSEPEIKEGWHETNHIDHCIVGCVHHHGDGTGSNCTHYRCHRVANHHAAPGSDGAC